MPKNAFRHLACPRCHGELSLGDTALACPSCGTDFPIERGVPCFAEGTSGWRLSAQVSSEEVLSVARKAGWQEALTLMDERRANWVKGYDRFTLSLLSSPKSRVLDCGSGWGALSFWLAKEFDHVFALDSQQDGLEFTGVRAEQEGIEHLTPVRGSVSCLPFDDGFFDVVVLNGVLEWVGTFSTDAPARSLQASALREIARVLKPNGTLFLAIENRYGLQYFLGYKEEHTGLRFVSLLPRPLANLYHRTRRGEALRVLTHSRRALNRLLKDSGFQESRWFVAHPSYRNCRYAASLDGPEPLSFLLGTLLEKRLPRPLGRAISRLKPLLKLGAFFSPSWIVFASPESVPRLGLQTSDGLAVLPSSSHLAVAINARRANLFEIEGKPAKLVAKHTIPLHERACQKTRTSFACIQYLARVRPQLKSHLPEPTLRPGKMGLIDYTPAVAGTPIDLDQERELKALLDVLLELDRVTIRREELQGVVATSDLRQALKEIARELGLLDSVGQVLDRAQVLHGDLNRGNVLVDRRNGPRVTLTDFEHARIGPSVLNWYDFVLRNVLLEGGQFPIPSGTLLRRLDALPGGTRAHRVLDRLTLEYLEGCRLSVDLHQPLLTLYGHHLLSDPITEDSERVSRALGQQRLCLSR